MAKPLVLRWRSCALCSGKPVNVCVTCRKNICESCTTDYRGSFVCKRCSLSVSQDIRSKKMKETNLSKEEIEAGLSGKEKI